MVKSQTNSAFNKAYTMLNQEQKLAVDTIEGPVMVVAGPGTGKTQTIALRIANILKKTDVDPGSILALTFTEVGAQAMRTRLAGLIGTPAYYVEISTFHSFCVKVMKDNPDSFLFDPSAEPLSELEKLKIIYHIIDTTSLTVLRPINSRYHYARGVIGALSDLKREGVSSTKLSEILDIEEGYLKSSEGEGLKKLERTNRVKNLKKNRELLMLYVAYEKELESSRRFDFEDMVNSVVVAFNSSEDLLLTYQEQYQYLMVDEYQDTNSAQNQLLLLLSSHWGEQANIMVTGDPDQSIMRFQGASIENQLSFIYNFPTASVITLKKNYRSTQLILDAADSLISHNNLRINDVVQGVDPHLTTTTSAGGPIQLVTVSTSLAEAIYIAEDIKGKLSSGVKANEIAVIYRNNMDSKLLTDVFAKYGIDYLVQGGANVLEDPTVKNFLTILKVVYEMRKQEEDEDLFTILHYHIFDLDPLDVLKLARGAGVRRLSLFDVMADSSLLSSLELKSQAKLESVLTKLSSWSAFDAENTFTATFEEILNKSGYLKSILGSLDVHHKLSRLNSLFEEVKKMNRFDHTLNLRSFLENLSLMQENNLRIEEDIFGVSNTCVTLTTAHKSKGLEWLQVYLYKGIDGTWGNNKSKDLIKLPEGILTNFVEGKKEKNEDERRLFYVALTRAKDSLTITRASSYSSSGVSRQSVPTMFISEIGDSSLVAVDTSGVENLAHLHLEKVMSKEDVVFGRDENAFLRPIIDNFSLSVTALNTYLECAYKFKLDKLFKVPHSKKPHLSFGTAIHKAFEEFYKKLKDDGAPPSKEFLLSTFRGALKKEVISKKDLDERIIEGEKLLTAYFDFYQNEFREPLFLEKFFGVKLDDIDLNGKIDRIEWSREGSREVRVVDYKTGKSKTMGQIEGTTADSHGDLKRQLVFYKLLIDLDKRLNNLSFGEAMLDFVSEPMEKDKDGRRVIMVTDQEVDDLKKIIKKSIEGIRAFEFPRTVDYKVCAKCYFLDHCYPEGLPNV